MCYIGLGCSPYAVESITEAKTEQTPSSSTSEVSESSKSPTKTWSFFFVDGDHTGDAPLRDVKLCCAHAHPERAIIVLHDVLFPEVCFMMVFCRNTASCADRSTCMASYALNPTFENRSQSSMHARYLSHICQNGQKVLMYTGQGAIDNNYLAFYFIFGCVFHGRVLLCDN